VTDSKAPVHAGTMGTHADPAPGLSFAALTCMVLIGLQLNAADVRQLRNLDTFLDQNSRISQPHTTRHAPCNLLYVVPMLIGR